MLLIKQMLSQHFGLDLQQQQTSIEYNIQIIIVPLFQKYRAVQQSTKMSKLKIIQANKVLSTSMSYREYCQPQWVSDTQLNYMSQYDFISYDLDQDKFDLIQKPMRHQILAVKYSPLIGHRNVRIIYLYKEQIVNDKQYSTVFYFVTLPSFNFSQDYCIKKIQVNNRKIKCIKNFVYFSDGQYAIFPVLYDDDSLGVVYMGFVNNLVIAYDIKENEAQDMTKVKNNYQIEYDNEYLSDKQIQQNEQNKLKKCHLMLTKQLNQFLFFNATSIYLFRVSAPTKQLVLADRVQIPAALKTKTRISKQSQQFIPYKDCVCICLSKTIIIARQHTNLLLYYVEQDKIKYGNSYDTRLDNINGQINCISGSFSSNKLLLSLANTSMLYQYKVNDIQETIQYVNCIDLQSEHGGHISKVIMSDTARNAAIFTLSCQSYRQNNHMDNNSYRHRQDILNFSIFKIQLYTQLGIPESSLYLKKIKYQNRNKRVSRLVISKIYQKVYALTGSEVHSLETHKISGVFFFDIHPCGFYMVVSYSFNIKIYSLEFNSMTLLYSTSMQHLKKVLYSPDGSIIILFSSRKIKFLDAYSFQLKQEINEKNYSILDVIFASKRNSILILYDNGMVSQRSFLDFQKVKTYRIFGHAHRKIITLRIDERNQNLFLLLQDGNVIVKNITNFTSKQAALTYQDDQKISEICIDAKNNLMFVGTRNGVLRIHNVSLQFQINDYTQINVTQSEITAITCSTLENFVYIGNALGDITMIKYNPYSQGTFLAKSSKILKNIAPKVAAYFSFDFQLVSAAKFQGNSQQNALQDKLQNLIERMQKHTDSFRKTQLAIFEQKQKQYENVDDGSGKNLYKDFQTRSKKVKIDIHNIRQKYSKQRKQQIQEYQTNLKQLFIIQDQLKIKKKQLQKSAERLKKRQQITSVQQEKSEKKNLAIQIQKFQLFYRKQHFSASLNDLDQDYRISDKDVLATLRQSLTQELNSLKVKCMQLNKGNSYLQTAKINILARKVQQQTLEHRINQQLKMLKQVTNKQDKKVANLSKQLKSTQDLIHHIQNKVKNTPNNVISSDKADSDLCSYKIWMKQKTQNQVTQLEQYLTGLQQNFQKKSMNMVQITTKIKKNLDNITALKKKRQNLRQKLKNLKYQLVTKQTHNYNLEKTVDPNLLAFYKNKDSICNFQTSKIKKITSMQKLNQRGLYAENKNIKIHMRKIKNLNTNNAELLNQYEKLKFQNKSLLDRQKQCILELKKAKQVMEEQKRILLQQGICSERTSLHQTQQTPFLKYVRYRASKTKRSLKLSMDSTAAVTPRMGSSRINSTVRSTTSRFY